MFTSNTSEERYQEYMDRFEPAEVAAVEVIRIDDEDTKLIITYKLSGKSWTDTKFAPSCDIDGLNDDELESYIEENLVD